jgi:hypothetical protein
MARPPPPTAITHSEIRDVGRAGGEVSVRVVARRSQPIEIGAVRKRMTHAMACGRLQSNTWRWLNVNHNVGNASASTPKLSDRVSGRGRVSATANTRTDAR